MYNRKNLFESRLASGIASAATSFSVTTGEGQYAPSTNFLVGIYPADYRSPSLAMKAGKLEYALVGTRDTDAMSSVTRGLFGTSALDHNESGKEYVVYCALLAEEMIGMNQVFKDVGGDDAYVIATGFGLTDLNRHDGAIFPLRVTTANTGACAVVVDSVTSKSIKVVDASGVRDPLTGELPASAVALLMWLEDDDYFVLLNPAQESTPHTTFQLVLVGSPISTGEQFYFPGASSITAFYAGKASRKVVMAAVGNDSVDGIVELGRRQTIVSIISAAQLTVAAVLNGEQWTVKLYADSVEVARTEAVTPTGTFDQMSVIINLY